MSVNKIILIGNIGNDPEIKEVNGNKLAKLSLATSEKYTNKQGEKVENSEWHNVTFWGRTAEVVEQYVKKGMKLYVEGSIKYNKVEKDGNTTYYTEVRGQVMQMLSKID